MAFILVSLVSASSAAAAQGEPFMFLQAEIDAINEIIMDLLNENRVLHYSQSTPLTLSSPEFKILAKWEIVKTEGAGDYDRVLYDSSVYATMERNVNIGWYRSVDGTTWEFFEGFISATPSVVVEQRFTPQTSLIAEFNFIAFAAENIATEGDPGVVKDFSGTITIHLPASESLSRLI